MLKDFLREYWLHKPTGRMWAMEIRNGSVVAAAGPLAAEYAVPGLLDYLTYVRSEAIWINRRRNEFVRVERP